MRENIIMEEQKNEQEKQSGSGNVLSDEEKAKRAAAVEAYYAARRKKIVIAAIVVIAIVVAIIIFATSGGNTYVWSDSDMEITLELDGDINSRGSYQLTITNKQNGDKDVWTGNYFSYDTVKNGWEDYGMTGYGGTLRISTDRNQVKLGEEDPFYGLYLYYTLTKK